MFGLIRVDKISPGQAQAAGIDPKCILVKGIIPRFIKTGSLPIREDLGSGMIKCHGHFTSEPVGYFLANGELESPDDVCLKCPLFQNGARASFML